MSNSFRTVRAPKRPTKAVGQRTMKLLIETALALLETMDIAEITSDLVLEKAGVSRGSLYHHFEDFSDLLEHALVQKFSAQVDDNVAVLAEMIEASASQDEMLARLSVVTQAIHAVANSRNRFFRARIIALAEANVRLMQRLSLEQQRLTDALAALFAEGQRRGWMRQDFDPAVASVFIQAYTLGRVIDDVSETKIDPAAWHAFVNKAIRALFC